MEEKKTFKMGNGPDQVSDCGTFANFFHKTCKSDIAVLTAALSPFSQPWHLCGRVCVAQYLRHGYIK